MSLRFCKFLPLLLAVSILPSVKAQDTRKAEPASTTTTTHHIKTVFLIVMENHNWTSDGSLDVKGNYEAPYINDTLLPMASHAENYNNPPGVHPSQPNYVWLEAGTAFGIRSDVTPQEAPQSTTNHLTTMLNKAGISWRSYDEDASGSSCPISSEGALDVNGSHLYVSRHDPFVYFNDVTNNLNTSSSYCIGHIRPFTQLATDLTANTVARYNFITPNICDDMHDSCGGNAIEHGDAWLKKTVPMIMNSAAYKDGGAIFITWDEANSGDGPIGMIVVSPYAKGHGFSNDIYYTHGSMLRTAQEIFGISPLIRYASVVPDLSNLFSVFP